MLLKERGVTMGRRAAFRGGGMKNRALVLVFAGGLFFWGAAALHGSPVHEISREYEKGGYTYSVAAAFFDPAGSARSVAVIEEQVDRQFAELSVRVVPDKELRAALGGFDDLKKDREFREWAKEADYCVIVIAVDAAAETGEFFYRASRRGGKEGAAAVRAGVFHVE
jgi:hypothetical protein